MDPAAEKRSASEFNHSPPPLQPFGLAFKLGAFGQGKAAVVSSWEEGSGLFVKGDLEFVQIVGCGGAKWDGSAERKQKESALLARAASARLQEARFACGERDVFRGGGAIPKPRQKEEPQAPFPFEVRRVEGRPNWEAGGLLGEGEWPGWGEQFGSSGRLNPGRGEEKQNQPLLEDFEETWRGMEAISLEMPGTRK